MIRRLALALLGLLVATAAGAQTLPGRAPGFRAGFQFLNVAAAVPRVVASRGEVPYALTAASTSANVRRASQKLFYIGAGGASELQLAFGGYYLNVASGDSNIGNAVNVVACAVRIGTTVVNVKVGGSATWTIADGTALQLSDKLLPSEFGLSSFAADTPIWVQFDGEVPVGGKYGKPGFAAATTASTGEITLTAATGSATKVGSTGAWTADGTWSSVNEAPIGPMMIIGKMVTPAPAHGYIGDSIDRDSAALYGDGYNGQVGGFWRSAAYSVGGHHLAQVNMACPTDRAQYAANASLTAKRRAIWPYVTHGTSGYGTNDGANGRTVAATLTDLRSLWAAMKAAGMQRVEQRLIIQRTTSTNSWNDAAGQTPISGFETGGAFRDPLNAAITANVGSNGLDDTLDLNDLIADPAQPDRWASNGTGGYRTSDGIHPIGAAHNVMFPRARTRMGTWTAQ